MCWDRPAGWWPCTSGLDSSSLSYTIKHDTKPEANYVLPDLATAHIVAIMSPPLCKGCEWQWTVFHVWCYRHDSNAKTMTHGCGYAVYMYKYLIQSAGD